MDSDEQDLQRQGYVNALRSATVLGAIRSGRTGRIAVIYVDWSDAFDQRIVVPWTVIGDQEQATIFARALEEKPTRVARGATSISGAIDFGRRLLMTAPFVAARKVIDISGDGKNNHGASVAQARSATLFCRTSPSTACRWSSRTGTGRRISGAMWSTITATA